MLDYIKKIQAFKKKIAKLPFSTLAKKYEYAFVWQERPGHDDILCDYISALYIEIKNRQFSQLYRYLCKTGCLELPKTHKNYFQYCRLFANFVTDKELGTIDSSYEIGSYYTKKGLGAHVVYFK